MDGRNKDGWDRMDGGIGLMNGVDGWIDGIDGWDGMNGKDV